MKQPLKVAIPEVVVSEQPATLPLPVVTARATVELLEVTTLPNGSSIVTTAWRENATPATVVAAGCVVMMSLLAPAGVIENAGLLVAELTPLEVAVTT
jgi:hypothetical protein